MKRANVIIAATVVATAGFTSTAQAVNVTHSGQGQSGSSIASAHANTIGVTAPRAAATADTLYLAAVSHDKKTLVRLGAKADLSRKPGDTAARVFALPQRSDRRYDNLAKVLRSNAAKETHEDGSVDYVWPRIAMRYTDPRDTRALAEAVRAGLLTKAQANRMKVTGESYKGWRVIISSQGVLRTFWA